MLRLRPMVLASVAVAALSACSRSGDAPAARISPPVDVGTAVRRADHAFRVEPHGFTGGHSTYAVAVDPAGRFAVAPIERAARRPGAASGTAATQDRHAGAAVRSGAPLHVETAAIEGVPATGAPSVALAKDGAVEIERGAVTERLRNGADGVEQSWAFHAPPPGGAVVVRVAVSGQAFVGETEHGLHFRDERSGLGARYGLATWIDAAGSETTLRPRYEAGEVVIEVPAELVAASAYPVLLDPFITPEAGMDVPVPVSDAHAAMPRMAFDGAGWFVVWHDDYGYHDALLAARVGVTGGGGVATALELRDPVAIPVMVGNHWMWRFDVAFDGEGFLVVWEDLGRVIGSRIGRDGRFLGSGYTILARGGPPALAFDGTSYVVAWSELRTGSYVIRSRRVSPSRPYETSPITDLATVTTSAQPQVVELQLSATGYLVAWSDSSTVHAVRAARDGGPLDAQPLVLGSGSEPRIASDGDGWLVTWQQYKGITDYDVMMRRVPASGALADEEPIAATAYQEIWPAVAFDGESYVVAWRDGSSALRYARVTRDGVLLDPGGGRAIASLGKVSQVALARGAGSELLLAATGTYAGPGLYATRMTAAGGAIDPAPVGIAYTAPRQLAPAVAFDGTNDLVVWDERRAGVAEIRGVLLAPGGTAVGDGTIPIATLSSASARESAGAAVAHDGTRYLVVWEDGARIRGARVSNAGVVEGSGAFFISPPLQPAGCTYWCDREHRRPEVSCSSESCLVTWIEAPPRTGGNPNGPVRGARVARDGTVLGGAGFAISPATEQPGTIAQAFDGANHLVAWSGHHPGIYLHVRATRVSPAGVVLDPVPIVVSPTTVRGEVGVAAGGGVFLVAWHDFNGGRAARISPGGALLDTTPLDVGWGVGDGAAAATWDGARFVVAHRRADPGVGGVANLFGAFVSPEGVVTPRGGFGIASGAALEPGPAIARAGSGKSVVVYERFDADPMRSAARVKARTLEPQGLGQRCMASHECLSGFCVDGVCCSTACTEQCGACDDPDSPGTCSPSTATAPRWPRPACASDGSVCGGVCNGGFQCSYPDASIACREGTCSGGIEWRAPHCDGAGRCPAPEQGFCGAYLCGPDACLTRCVTQADCIPNHYCTAGECRYDDVPPVITVPADLSVEAVGPQGAPVTFEAIAEDAMTGPRPVTCLPRSGTLFPLGDTEVTCMAGDGHGNAGFASFTVRIVDTTAPAFQAVASPAPVEATGPAGAAVRFDRPVALDIVDGVLTATCTPPPGATFPVGRTAVTCVAADRRDNRVSAEIAVVVTDTTPPVLSVPAPIQAEATSAAGAAVGWPAVAAVDVVDGTGAASCLPAAGSTFPLGATTVTCSAADSRGNASSAQFTVTVVDLTAPALALPAPMSAEATGPGGALVSWSPPSASDAVDVAVPVACSHASGSLFPLGVTAVQCSATDAAGNTAVGGFTVTVADTTAPVVAVPGAVSVEATGPGGAVVTFAASAEDVAAGPRSVTCAPASGSLFALGDTPVTCVASDGHGNSGSASFAVTVVDTTAPAFVAVVSPKPVEATGPEGAAVLFAVPMAVDAVDGLLTAACGFSPGATFPVGRTAVTCVAADRRGNGVSAEIAVVVTDTTPPALSVPASIQAEATSAAGAAVSWPAVVGADLVDGARTATCLPAAGSTFPLGATTVTCSAVDSRGNASSAPFTVTVVDLTAPALALPAPVTAEATGPGGAVVTWPGPSASDAVDGAVPVACSPGSGDLFPLGVTAVQCSATDAAGNASVGGFTVAVLDTTPPVVTVPAVVDVPATGTTSAVATFSASAVDVVSGSVQTECTPASGALFPLGLTEVTCTAVDAAGNQGFARFPVVVAFQLTGGGIVGLAPDGSSSFPAGRPVPLRFRLEGASAGAAVTARVFVAPVVDGTVGAVQPAESRLGPGNTFRPLGASDQYFFMLDTAGLAPGSWILRVDLGDGVPRDVPFTVT